MRPWPTGCCHLLIRDGLVDTDDIRERTEGFERVREVAATYWPERVERITGVPEEELVQAARLLGRAKTAMVLIGRRTEQQTQGVTNILSFINLAQALGKVGRPYSGYGCLTGQGNSQGGREHGQKADQLPGYRLIADPAARQHIATVWDFPEDELPGPGKSAYELLDSLEPKAVSGRCWYGVPTWWCPRPTVTTSGNGWNLWTFWWCPTFSCRKLRRWPTWYCPPRSGLRKKGL